MGDLAEAGGSGVSGGLESRFVAASPLVLPGLTGAILEASVSALSAVPWGNDTFFRFLTRNSVGSRAGILWLFSVSCLSVVSVARPMCLSVSVRIPRMAREPSRNVVSLRIIVARCQLAVVQSAKTSAILPGADLASRLK